MNSQLLTLYVHYLTRRQREVVYLVAQGLKNKEVADVLAVEPCVVAQHLTAIYQTMGMLEGLSEQTSIHRGPLISLFAVFFHLHPELIPQAIS